jgi:O-antigen/teichoic acid export membrane protein
MLSFAISVVLSYAIGAVVLRKRLKPHTSGLAPRYDTKGWLRISTSLMINAGMYLVLGQLNVLMMGVMLGETSTGIFSAAVRLASLVSFMLTAINMTASPLVSETYARGDMKGLQRVCRTSGRAGFLFAAAVFAGLAIGGRWVLGLFGPAFHEAYVPLLILAAGQLFSSFCGQNGTVATMTGRTSSLTKVLIAAAVINALLNAALIPAMGMLGGAIAASLSIALWNTAMVVIVKRQLGIQTMAWPLRGGKE